MDSLFAACFQSSCTHTYSYTEEDVSGQERYGSLGIDVYNDDHHTSQSQEEEGQGDQEELDVH